MMKPFLIAHLCLAFTLFLAGLSDPYLGEHYYRRENHVRLMNLKGDPSLLSSASLEEGEHLRANQALWKALPEEEKSYFENFDLNPGSANPSPPSLLLILWASASVALSILTLKGRASGLAYFFIIPLLSLLLVLDRPKRIDPFALPPEAILTTKYLKSPVEGSIKEQMDLLRRAFELYLIDAWGNETPDSDPAVFKQQVQRGMFAYNKAQLNYRFENKSAGSQAEAGPLWLALFVLWNGALYVIVAGSRWRSRQNTPQQQEG